MEKLCVVFLLGDRVYYRLGRYNNHDMDTSTIIALSSSFSRNNHGICCYLRCIHTSLVRFPKELEVGLPQRLQTSMSLYSNNLSGLVLLTDDAYMSLEGSKMTNEFNLCSSVPFFYINGLQSAKGSCSRCIVDLVSLRLI